MNDPSLTEIDDAHQQARAAAEKRMEQAEECIAYYRLRMSQLQDAFLELSRAEGFTDAEGFRAEVQSVTDRTYESIWEARRVITRFEEEDEDMRLQQRHERERYLQGR